MQFGDGVQCLRRFSQTASQSNASIATFMLGLEDHGNAAAGLV